MGEYGGYALGGSWELERVTVGGLWRGVKIEELIPLTTPKTQRLWLGPITRIRLGHV